MSRLQLGLNRRLQLGISPATGVGWNGQLFTAGAGVAIDALANAANGYSTAYFDSIMTNTRLDQLVNAGFDHGRLMIDPTPALSAADDIALAAAVDIARYAVDKLIAKGLKVILDMHIAGTGTWSMASIEPDYPSGAKWVRYLIVVKEFAKLALRYSNTQVAFEQWNETTIAVGGGWPQRAKSIFDAVRTVNRNTTVLVSGASFAGATGLQELNAANFDANTGFVVHDYNPLILSHQGLEGYDGAAVTRLSWPANRGERAASTAGLTDPVLGYVNTYFDTAPFGYSGPAIDSYIAGISSWRSAQGVAASRIFITEFGIRGDYVRPGKADLPGATRISRAAWLQDVELRHGNIGHSRSVFAYNSPGPWDITNSFVFDDAILGALGKPALLTFDTDASALLSRISVANSNARNGLINAVFLLLKEAGVFGKLDVFHVPALFRAALNNKADAFLNWKSTSFNLLEAAAGGGFVDNKGWASDGAVGYLNTQWAPGVSIGSVASQDSVHIGLYQSDVGNAGTLIGNGATLATVLKSTGATTALNNGGQASNFFVPTASDATLLASRVDSAGYYQYLSGSIPENNAVLINKLAVASTTPSATTVKVGRPSSFSTARFGVMVGGSGLTAAEARDMSTIMRLLMQGMSRS